MAISISSVSGSPSTTLNASPIPSLTTAQASALNSINLGNISLSSSTASSSTGYGAIPSITVNGMSGSYTYGNSPTVSISSAPEWSSDFTVRGDSTFYGDVTIKGKSILELLERMEHQLAIFTPNPELETRWEELRDLAKRYRELEADLRDKEKMWEILKR